ncbi:spermidine/putrescine transport system substrate-binding protein [Granulicatella balaenopterae]|uniref:Spermidine/putrescine transport system substrate-binding protein n=1 Tax=Granulicatella balaenopterae TaxID=137733 RepID=A0A1H9PJG9_9LACT|nr:ABC transporter substrate-binding protein [Granulicatella balaenopterae]SER47995.1 spermidine/putrescine transport system substrate-binding protein [Granulicatella balaenopterae]
MKKLTLLTTTIILAIVGLVAVRNTLDVAVAGSSDTITMYNWGDYIDPELLKEFEEETGYHVIYETFDSNEAMYTKIKQGGTNYDIAVPSEYMIDKMIDEDLLLPLDHSKLPSINHIDPRFLDQSFDPGNVYSIPYFWGTLGIVYNTEMISEGAITSWQDLWKEDFRNSILFIDGAREMIGLTLQSEGYSLNEKDEAIVREAGAKLKQLMPNAKAIIADEMKMYMIQEEAPIGVTFSGEAAMMLEGNEHLTYLIPSEGTNVWFDNLVIPKTAKNIDGAYALMNFINRPENAARNAEYIGYSTPNKDAKELLPIEVIEDPGFYPNDEQMDHMEVYENLGTDALGLYNDLFLEAKIFRN